MNSMGLLENNKTIALLSALSPAKRQISSLVALVITAFRPGVFFQYYGGVARAKPTATITQCGRWAWQSIRNSLEMTFDFAMLLHKDCTMLVERHRKNGIENIESLRVSLGMGRPLVTYASHTGPFFNVFLHPEIIQHIKKRQVIILAPKQGQSRKIALEAKLQELVGQDIKIVGIDQADVGLQVLRTLRAKGIIVCTIDVSFPHTRNIATTFLDRPLELPGGIIELGIRSHAVFVGCIPSFGEDGNTVSLLDPVVFENPKHDVGDALMKLLSPIEEFIRNKPGRYLMWPWFGRYQKMIEGNLARTWNRHD